MKKRNDNTIQKINKYNNPNPFHQAILTPNIRKLQGDPIENVISSNL